MTGMITVLWMECLCLPQIHMLKPSLPIWLNLVIGHYRFRVQGGHGYGPG